MNFRTESPDLSPASTAEAQIGPPGKARGERIFRIVGVAILLLLAIGAAPGWFCYKGYRRARWADERGIEVLVKVEFGAFAPSLRASEGAALGRRSMDTAGYRQLAGTDCLAAEAGGNFWSGFYGLGTQFYHHTAGNRTMQVLSAAELAERRQQATEKRDRRKLEADKRCERLVALLGDDDFRKREAATEELRRMGAVALPYLRKAAGSSDAEVADRAGRLASEIAGQTPGSGSR